MFEILKYRVLFTTFDMEQSIRIQNILTENNIFFIHKTKNNGHGNKTVLGKLGENPNYSVEYCILVKYKDYEQAKFVTNIF